MWHCGRCCSHFELRQRLKLPGLARSLHFLHRPPPGTNLATLHARNHPAWRRVKFDEVLAQQKKLGAGQLHPFTGPITDNEGRTVLPAGQQLSDEQILSMNYLVAGVVGKVSR